MGKSLKSRLVRNPYEVLEISPTARLEVISAAHKALKSVFAPNKGGSPDILSRVEEAYKLLTDTEAKAKFDAERLNLVDKQIGDHKILSVIAEGGFGTTYKAEDQICGGVDCIKDCSNVSSEYWFILEREFNTIRDMSHPGLPIMRRMYKMDDGRLAIVMSYIPGKTLEQIVEKTGKLDPEHVAWIAERILNTLKYLHFHGVVHGDLKPQNIIIKPKEHAVVLIDFGLALVKPKADDESLGFTEEFAPPEEMAGGTLVPESDLYSLGMTMVYALGGGMDAVKKIEVPDSVPNALCDFVLRLLVRDVAERPHWGKEDLCETISEVRKKAFGRVRSDMKALPAFIDEE